MKSRGVYETPGGTILLAAHRGIECITLDRGAMHLKDELMPQYAALIYNGFWFAPEREMLQAAIDYSQQKVTGQVRVKLYKGNVTVIGRDQPLLALRPGPGHLRGGRGRLRPPRRGGLHQAQRAAPARCRPSATSATASRSSRLYGYCRGSRRLKKRPLGGFDEGAVHLAGDADIDVFVAVHEADVELFALALVADVVDDGGGHVGRLRRCHRLNTRAGRAGASCASPDRQNRASLAVGGANRRGIERGDKWKRIRLWRW